MAMMAGVGLQPVLQIETVWLDVVHRSPNQCQSRAIWPEFCTLDGGHHNVLCAVPWRFEPDGRSSPVRGHSSSTVVASSSVLASFFLCVTLSRSRDGGVPSKGNGGPGPRTRCCSPFGHRARHKAGRPVGGRQRRGGLPLSPQNSARHCIAVDLQGGWQRGTRRCPAALWRYASPTSRTSGAGTVGPRAARMGNDPWSAAGVMTPG